MSDDPIDDLDDARRAGGADDADDLHGPDRDATDRDATADDGDGDGADAPAEDLDAVRAPDAGDAPAGRGSGYVEDPDDLDGFTSPMHRLAGIARYALVAIVVVALVIPGGAWLFDELDFRRSADAVVATVQGTLAGDAAAEAVVLVRAVGCPGQGNGSGTAFVVDTPQGRALLTNRHVVEDTARVGVRSLDGSTDVEVTGVRLSTVADVAVLEVADPDALPPALLLASGASAGDEVRLVGFPAATPFTTAGEVAEVAGGRMLLDLEVAPGASGSPVVGVDGRVVGQVHAVTGDGQGVATSVGALPAAIADSVAAPPC